LLSRIASFDTAAFNRAFGRDLERRRQECRALGLTQRQHALTVALPRYARKVASRCGDAPLISRADGTPAACLNSLATLAAADRTEGETKPNG
jgi:hypothetical protein